MAIEPEAPPSPHPLGAAAPDTDHVGLAFRALPFGVALGTGFNAMVTFGVRTLQAGAPAPTTAALDSGPAWLLLGGTVLGLLAGAISVWILLAPTRSPYRQGMLGMVSAFGSLLMSVVLLPIADHGLGRVGLGLCAAVAALICILLFRAIQRLG